MKFRVCGRNEFMRYERDTVFLRYDNWDDYGFKTMFGARYIDEHGNEHSLGAVQIGMVNMDAGKTFDHIPKSFITIPEQFFSMVQDFSKAQLQEWSLPTGTESSFYWR